jgi:hypothetical protein
MVTMITTNFFKKKKKKFERPHGCLDRALPLAI